MTSPAEPVQVLPSQKPEVVTRETLYQSKQGFLFYEVGDLGNRPASKTFPRKLQCHRNHKSHLLTEPEVEDRSKMLAHYTPGASNERSLGPGSNLSQQFLKPTIYSVSHAPMTSRALSETVIQSPSPCTYTPHDPIRERPPHGGSFAQARRAGEQHTHEAVLTSHVGPGTYEPRNSTASSKMNPAIHLGTLSSCPRWPVRRSEEAQRARTSPSTVATAAAVKNVHSSAGLSSDPLEAQVKRNKTSAFINLAPPPRLRGPDLAIGGRDRGGPLTERSLSRGPGSYNVEAAYAIAYKSGTASAVRLLRGTLPRAPRFSEPSRSTSPNSSAASLAPTAGLGTPLAAMKNRPVAARASDTVEAGYNAARKLGATLKSLQPTSELRAKLYREAEHAQMYACTPSTSDKAAARRPMSASLLDTGHAWENIELKSPSAEAFADDDSHTALFDLDEKRLAKICYDSDEANKYLAERAALKQALYREKRMFERIQYEQQRNEEMAYAAQQRMKHVFHHLETVKKLTQGLPGRERVESSSVHSGAQSVE